VYVSILQRPHRGHMFVTQTNNGRSHDPIGVEQNWLNIIWYKVKVSIYDAGEGRGVSQLTTYFFILHFNPPA